MAVRKTTKRLYLIPVLSKALDILELLQAENQPMTLEAIHRQTRISKTTVYRVLKTFVHRGYLSQSPDGLYRQVTRPKKMRFGFWGQSGARPFSVAVRRIGGMGDGVGPAGGGTARQEQNDGRVRGSSERHPDLPVESFVRIDGRGMRDKSKKLISDFLQRHPKDKHILIATATDSSALGAVDAVREQKRDKHVAFVGQDCIPEAIAWRRKHHLPIVRQESHEA